MQNDILASVCGIASNSPGKEFKFINRIKVCFLLDCLQTIAWNLFSSQLARDIIYYFSAWNRSYFISPLFQWSSDRNSSYIIQTEERQTRKKKRRIAARRGEIANSTRPRLVKIAKVGKPKKKENSKRRMPQKVESRNSPTWLAAHASCAFLAISCR